MAYKVCSNCNEDNSESASVCSSCSHHLLNSKVYGIPANDIPKAKKGKFCSNCSEKLDEDSFKCKYCGHMTVPSPTQDYSYRRHTYQSPSADNSSAVILLFIATFLIPLVGLIVGGIYALDDDPDKSSIGKGLIIFGLIMIVLGVILWNVLI